MTIEINNPPSGQQCWRDISKESLVSNREDPTLRNARREAIIIVAVWALVTIYCCVYSYFTGYIRTGKALGLQDVQPVLGMPSWFFWGVIVPWILCTLFTFWFAGIFMTEDDLGSDHAAELESDIREGGEDE